MRDHRLCTVFVLFGFLLAGCNAPQRTVSGETPYARSFEAAKSVLRDASFELDRVDARAGIITTHPRSSAGLATPWIDHTETLGEATSDLMNSDRRIAVVRFSPAGRVEDERSSDLRAYDGVMLAEVTVERERLYRPDQRVDPTSIRLRSRTIDPALRERGMSPVFASPLPTDRRLAERLSKRIADLAEADVSASPSTTR